MSEPKTNIYEAIFSKYDTDKVNPGNYHIAYEDCFAAVRKDVKVFFELGVNRGGSIRASKEYFPNAHIVGIEITPKCYFEEDGISIEIGDATTEEFISQVIQKHGKPDIVIDDASHYSSQIKKSFDLLWPHTQYCYVIEDYGTQSLNFRGGLYVDDNIPATNIASDMLIKLLKGEGDFKSLTAYSNICFFFK